MRRTASEVIRDLESRIARLEHQEEELSKEAFFGLFSRRNFMDDMAEQLAEHLNFEIKKKKKKGDFSIQGRYTNGITFRIYILWHPQDVDLGRLNVEIKGREVFSYVFKDGVREIFQKKILEKVRY